MRAASLLIDSASHMPVTLVLFVQVNKTVGVVGLALPVGVVGLALPVGMVGLALPVGVVDLVPLFGVVCVTPPFFVANLASQVQEN